MFLFGPLSRTRQVRPTARSSQRLFFGRDAIQILVGSNEDLAVADGWRGTEVLSVGRDSID